MGISHITFSKNKLKSDLLINLYLLAMLDYLIEDNNLKSVLLHEEITNQDILFIKELIAGYIDPVTGNYFRL